MDEVRSDIRPSFRLRPDQRVKSPKEFADAKGKGRRINTPSFTFQLVSRDGHSRLGLIVSKKVGNSPRRCRVKRLVRECFRLRPELFPANCDVFVIARSACILDSFQDVVSEVEAAKLTV
jgi:ribonuclease P protein component